MHASLQRSVVQHAMTSAVPAVSVLMTVYNRSQFIGAAIQSVLDSTFRDFELLVVDDGSSDDSVSIARKYAERDERVSVIVNEKNYGDYPNRNRAAALARGQYLKYVDADDILYPVGLELLVSAMQKFPEAGYGLCSLDQDEHRPFPFQLSSREAYLRHYFGAPLFHKAPLSSIIRRQAFEAVGGFSTRRFVGDMEMWHRLSARFPVVLMGGGIVWYRVHGSQEMTLVRGNPTGAIARSWDVTREWLARPECPLSAAETAEVARRLRMRKLQLVLIKAARIRPLELVEIMRLETAIIRQG